MFKRRMGMRNYFKELKMNMQRIKKSKQDKAKSSSGKQAVGAGKEFKEEKKKISLKKSTAGDGGPEKSTGKTSGTTTATQGIKSKATSSVATKKKKK